MYNNSMAKREQKVQMLRILEIDSMIRDGNFPSTEKMIKKFEVSRPTIMRGIEFLRDWYNTPLEKSIKNIFKKIMDILPDEISVDSFFYAG